MNDTRENRSETIQTFFVVQFVIVVTLQVALMRPLLHVTMAKFQAFDTIAYVAYWLFIATAATTISAAFCSLLFYVGLRRTSHGCAVLLASLSIILLAANAASYLTFGVHLTHPTVLSAFSLTGLNFGITVSTSEAVLIGSGLFTAGLCQWGVLHLVSRFMKPLKWRTLLPRIALLCGGSLLVVLFWTRSFGPIAIPYAAIWGYEKLFLGAYDLELNPIPTYKVDGLESTNLPVRPSILTIQIESLRWDVVTKDIAPHIVGLSNSEFCSNSAQHYAGSNLTAKGTFSLLSGLSAYRYHSFGKGRVPSLPLAILRNNGYRIHALDASGMLTYPVPPLDVSQFDSYEQLIDGRSDVSDETQIVDRLRQRQTSETDDRPSYTFVFLYATHDPYMYPDHFQEVFTPSLAPSEEYLSRSKSVSEVRQGIKNRFKNSVRYVDSVVGEILAIFGPAIEAGKLIVVVTGDHGEEFWEFGARGHVGGKFQDVRSRVPLVMCYAGKGGRVWPLSTHADIFPTMFSWMGLQDSPAFQMLDGTSLDNPVNSDHHVVVSDASFPRHTPDFAIVTPGMKFLFTMQSSDPVDATLAGLLENDVETELTDDYRNKAASHLKIFGENWHRFFRREFRPDMSAPGKPEPSPPSGN